MQRDREFAAHFGVLVCSLLATFPECFTNKHTQFGRPAFAGWGPLVLVAERGQLIGLVLIP